MGQTNSNIITKQNIILQKQNLIEQQSLTSEELIEQSRQIVVKVNELFDKILSTRTKSFEALGISKNIFQCKYSQKWSVDDDFTLFSMQLNHLDILFPMERFEPINQYAFEISMIKIGIVSLLCQINRLMDQIINQMKKSQKVIKDQLKNCLKVLNSSIVRLEDVLLQRFVCLINSDHFVKCLRSASLKNQFKKFNEHNFENRNQSQSFFLNNSDMSVLSTNQSFDHNYLENII